MKRRTKHGIISALVLILLFSPSGCSSRKLEYHGNLGYDLSNIDYEEVVFNIYHSNTEQHTWEKLTEFLCSPEKGHYADIRLEGSENRITAIVEDNYVAEENDTETFYTEDINSYEFAINRFQGTLNGFQTFEIEDTDEEQYYRLYPVTNDSGISYSRDLSLNTPYDEEEVNLDNILITMTIE